MTDVRINVVWAVLLSATALTWWLGEYNGLGGEYARITAATVLTLSVIKGWCIVQDYMELRRGPKLWRFLMLAWVIVMALILFVGFFWYTLKY
ncbi:MAG: cytochrome C oxidase subunit IV family protein [Burkholderiales bacterium]|nr:cytochrome C oxidase subunit IV family protein [Burkholderiales bacterium]